MNQQPKRNNGKFLQDLSWVMKAYYEPRCFVPFRLKNSGESDERGNG